MGPITGIHSHLLITFSCYGWHIPGQPGAIDRHHNAPGAPLPEPRPRLCQYVEARLKQAPFEMDAGQRFVTLEAIREVCLYKGWPLRAAQVRTNHIHTVVDVDVAPEMALDAFKRYASRALNLLNPQQKSRSRWARHGSTRHLWSAEIIDAAVHYILEKQGEPMACYPSLES
ncbi:MAG: transposase [Bryobacteraceae bacterium]